jgi:uncharacterized membrane protein YoaK (UPF0700 family)
VEASSQRPDATRRVEPLLLVAVAGVVALGLPVGGGDARRYVVIGLLAVALGLQNATVRRLAVADVTTTVLTQTLTGWLPTPGSPVAAAPEQAAGLPLSA